MFKFLLDKGIDIGMKDENGQTALITAIIYKEYDFFEQLLLKSEEMGNIVDYVDQKDNHVNVQLIILRKMIFFIKR